MLFLFSAKSFNIYFALVMGKNATGSLLHAMPDHSEPVGLGLAGKWAGVKMKRRDRKKLIIPFIQILHPLPGNIGVTGSPFFIAPDRFCISSQPPPLAFFISSWGE